MNFGELKRQVHDVSQTDEARAHFQPRELNRFVQDAHYKVFRNVANNFEGFFHATAFISEVTDTSEYDLPANLYQLIEIYEDDASASLRTPLSKVSRDSFQKYEGTGRYRRYCLWGQSRIELAEASSKTEANSIRLEYIYRPAEMIEDDDVPFQKEVGVGGAGKPNLVEFHDVIWKLAMNPVFIKEGAFGQASHWKSEALEQMRELQAHLDDINSAESRFVNDGVSLDYDGGWDGPYGGIS